MPRGLKLYVEARGVGKTAEDLAVIGRRMRDARPAFERVMPVLEAGEARHFAGLGGRFVMSGALRDSLTQASANGAIRETHGSHLVFGTSIFYARFQRKGRKSAVLVVKPKEKRQAATTIMDWIVEGIGS
jgi:hypothetical protein